MEYQGQALSIFRNYYGLFNNIFSSILTTVCLANKTQGDNCISIVEYYQETYNKLFPGNNLNIIKFILAQNILNTNLINSLKKRIMTALMEYQDSDLNNLINMEMPVVYISQNISQNENKINIYRTKNTFSDVFDFMTNGLLIMSSNKGDKKEIVYIIDKEDNNDLESPFIHIKSRDQLSQYQLYYYYIILNYRNFMKRLNIINSELLGKNHKLIYSLIKMAEIFIIVNCIFYIILAFILSLYIQKYFIFIANLINGIQNKMNLKNDNISVKEMFLQKIEKLKIIISLYKQDMYQAIVDLNFIYDNYKKLIEEKNKEIAKFLKKEKYLNDSNNNYNYAKNSSNKIKIKYIISCSQNKKYIIFIIIFFFYSICLCLSLMIMWESYTSLYGKIQKIIQANGALSSDSYKYIIYYQFMIFHNLTIEDINKYEGYNESTGQDLFSSIYGDLQNVYEIKKLINHLDGYNLDKIDEYVNFTCPTFYNYLFKSHKAFKNLDIHYKDIFVFICEQSGAFKYNNYKQTFTILFENVIIGINKVNDHSYQGLISNIYNEFLPKITMMYLGVYSILFEILANQSQKIPNQKINTLIGYYIKICFSIFYASSFSFLLIIIFGYIWNINNYYNKVHEIKKVFKVCNKKE